MNLSSSKNVEIVYDNDIETRESCFSIASSNYDEWDTLMNRNRIESNY